MRSEDQNMQTTATERSALLPNVTDVHGTVGTTSHVRAPDIFEDVVTLNCKNIGFLWLQCSFVWLLGFSLSIVTKAYPSAHSDTSKSGPASWIVLLGTIWGIIGSVLVLRAVLSHSTIILDQHMHHLQATGVNMSRTHIALSSFPLMRLLLCLIGVSLGMLLSIFVSEGSCFAQCHRGAIGVTKAMLPMLLFAVVAFIFVSCLQNVSISLPVLILLAILEVVFMLIKFYDDSVFSLTISFIPFWLFLCVTTWEIVRALAHGIRRNVSLNKYHLCQLLVMSIAVFLGVRSSFQICHINIFSSGHNTVDEAADLSVFYLDKVPWIGWLISIWLLYISFCLTFISSWVEHANRRGFISPLNIERTGQGWEPIPSKQLQRPGVLVVNAV